MQVRGYYCTVKDAPWGESIVNTTSAGRAKAEYWHSVRDAWPDIPFTAVRCRLSENGKAISGPGFLACVEGRGIPEARCGMKISHSAGEGVIVGHDSSANLEILFAPESKYPGQVLSVHPSEIGFLDKSPPLG